MDHSTIPEPIVELFTLLSKFAHTTGHLDFNINTLPVHLREAVAQAVDHKLTASRISSFHANALISPFHWHVTDLGASYIRLLRATADQPSPEENLTSFIDQFLTHHKTRIEQLLDQRIVEGKTPSHTIHSENPLPELVSGLKMFEIRVLEGGHYQVWSPANVEEESIYSAVKNSGMKAGDVFAIVREVPVVKEATPPEPAVTGEHLDNVYRDLLEKFSALEARLEEALKPIPVPPLMSAEGVSKRLDAQRTLLDISRPTPIMDLIVAHNGSLQIGPYLLGGFQDILEKHGLDVGDTLQLVKPPTNGERVDRVKPTHLTEDEIRFWTRSPEEEPPFDLKKSLLRDGWMNLEADTYHKVFVVPGPENSTKSYRVTVTDGKIMVSQRDTRAEPNLVGVVEIPMNDDQTTYDFVTLLLKGREVV